MFQNYKKSVLKEDKITLVSDKTFLEAGFPIKDFPLFISCGSPQTTRDE